jgi:hypothetical protein
MFETKIIKNNVIVEITKIEITIPLLDWEKDKITCFSTNRELIHLSIYKDILLKNPNVTNVMHGHLFKLIIQATDISELDKCLFEQWDLSYAQFNIFSWRECNSIEATRYRQNKIDKIFDRLNGDNDRILRDYNAALSSSLENVLSHSYKKLILKNDRG